MARWRSGLGAADSRATVPQRPCRFQPLSASEDPCVVQGRSPAQARSSCLRRKPARTTTELSSRGVTRLRQRLLPRLSSPHDSHAVFIEATMNPLVGGCGWAGRHFFFRGPQGVRRNSSGHRGSGAAGRRRSWCTRRRIRVLADDAAAGHRRRHYAENPDAAHHATLSSRWLMPLRRYEHFADPDMASRTWSRPSRSSPSRGPSHLSGVSPQGRESTGATHVARRSTGAEIVRWRSVIAG